MKRKINNSLIGTATLAILATLLLTVAVCYNIFKNQVMEDLRVYTEIIRYAAGVDEGNLTSEMEQLLIEEELRITLVDGSGLVMLDTAVDEAVMENHGDRPEIKAAFAKGEGSVIRRSGTLEKDTYYYAIRMDNGCVLRVSRQADNIYQIVDSAIPYLLILIGVVFGLCLVLSFLLAEGIIRPIRLIAEDVENVEKTESYEELTPYIEAIKNQHDDVLQNALIRQEFTANVSHELKTPLTAISGYSELIENGMVSSESETRRFAREIHKNANRLLTLINDVIRLSELDGANTEELLEPVNLKEIAQTCVSMLQINAEKHKVSLSFEGEDVTIMATRQMAEEVLYNLCDNAIRYNKEGGRVHVSVKAKSGTAVLSVKDTGIGIPKEHQERIFERFYRVDKSRSKSTGGTGLGLAIVKHILLRLKAVIAVNSEEGKGTEITVTFPIDRMMSGRA
ncbi:MAG: ATP-binding protein [Lachnospiraceae bacterium]|nr:ATP-binding protein [Lachnospiraceae bacterium]